MGEKYGLKFKEVFVTDIINDWSKNDVTHVFEFLLPLFRCNNITDDKIEYIFKNTKTLTRITACIGEFLTQFKDESGVIIAEFECGHNFEYTLKEFNQSEGNTDSTKDSIRRFWSRRKYLSKENLDIVLLLAEKYTIPSFYEELKRDAFYVACTKRDFPCFESYTVYNREMETICEIVYHPNKSLNDCFDIKVIKNIFVNRATNENVLKK